MPATAAPMKLPMPMRESRFDFSADNFAMSFLSFQHRAGLAKTGAQHTLIRWRMTALVYTLASVSVKRHRHMESVVSK